MKITSHAIERSIYEGFSMRYKSFGNFVDSKYFQACLAAVRDEELLSHIIFCNDVLGNPPVNTFLRARPVQTDLEDYEKRAIGAFWGYVFKYVFLYANQKSVAARVNTVRTATYYLNPPEAVKIVKGR